MAVRLRIQAIPGVEQNKRPRQNQGSWLASYINFIEDHEIHIES